MKQKTKTVNVTSESSVRALAKRRGLKLEKGRGVAVDYYGPDKAYRVVDPARNMVVLGGHPNGFGRSLKDCAEFIDHNEGSLAGLL